MTRIRKVIETAVISAFTLAAALIWRDVIIGFIEFFVPPGEELFYKLLAAVVATIILVIAIFVVLKTEREADYVLARIKKRSKK